MIRWILAVPFFLLFGILAVGQTGILIENFRNGKGSSAFPFIGGISGVIGLAILDWKLALYWFWVPLLLDWGSFPLLFITLCYWLTGEMARDGYINSIPRGELTDSPNSPLFPWCAEENRNLGWSIPFNFKCWRLTTFARRADMDELAAMNRKSEVMTLHYQIGNRHFVDFTGRYPNYKAWKNQIVKNNGIDEYLSPDEFLIREEAGSITREDWRNLCLWILEHGCNDPVIIDVAANGMEDWQSRPGDTNHIRQLAGILHMAEKSKLKCIERTQIDKYKAGEFHLGELIRRMEAIWLRHSDYDDLQIWFALSESLEYYDHGKGPLIYKLDAKNPLKSAEDILRKSGKL